MVQEYVSPVRVHKYTFEMVMAAYERRFPCCPQIPVVVDCAIIEDCWSKDNSQRWTTRRCKLTIEAPYLIKKMIGTEFCYFLQKNHLDLKARTLEIEATNETFATKVEVLEKCRYFVHPDNAEWTCFEQTAILDVKSFLGLEGTVEKISMKQYAANIAKGKELIESFMKEVTDTGVTELRPWSEFDPKHNRELREVLCRGIEPLTQLSPEVAKPLIAPGARALRKRNQSFSNLSEYSIYFEPSTEGIMKICDNRPTVTDTKIWQQGFESTENIYQYMFYPDTAISAWTHPFTIMQCTSSSCDSTKNTKSKESKDSTKTTKSCYSLKSKPSNNSPKQSPVQSGITMIAKIERQLRTDSLAHLCAKAECSKLSCRTCAMDCESLSLRKSKSGASIPIEACKSIVVDSESQLNRWNSLVMLLVSVLVVGGAATAFFRFFLPRYRRAPDTSKKP